LPLLVVPIAPQAADQLTLSEWDLLIGCERVLFEQPEHPLAERLRKAGVEAGPFDDEPEATQGGWALVADPSSARLYELAKSGAMITSGAMTAPDDLTAARGAYLGRRAAAALGNLALVMARLRGPDGCPWDAEQTHESLQAHLLEETHEVLDAIDKGQTGAELQEELGDLLLQVVFHAQLAAGDGRFDLAGVADGIVAKLIRRHPHVFGDVSVSDSSEVLRNWESIKKKEKAGKPGPESAAADDIPAGLPALLAAYKTQKRAAPSGWSASGEQAREEALAALGKPAAEAVGPALFWIVAVARAAGIDPEGALRREIAKFRASSA
jgi:MazG family protein